MILRRTLFLVTSLLFIGLLLRNKAVHIKSTSPFGLIGRLLNGYGAERRPNIIFILTDDQDVRLGSLDYMQNVQDHIIGRGLNLHNHFGTVALCCPARATLLRGQAAHNTNITHVGAPGGGYPKWLRTGEWKNYLPLWLKKAGYNTAYFGKFMNGYGMRNYHRSPHGWDLTDLLVQPYIYSFRNVVMSENGAKPVHYPGWHQIDVLRVKAFRHLDYLTSQPEPFYLEIAPASPHVVPGGFPTIPPDRHKDKFPGLKAPRLPNWNPADDYQKQKPAWLTGLPLMNDTIIDVVDRSYRARIQALQGVDELVGDMIALLEAKGVIDNTYIIYTTDNGFHLGQHRVPGGKGLPYIADVNLPFAVRGSGISPGKFSNIPSTHVDVAPTLLDIAGVPRSEWPPFFDGRSLLGEWRSRSVPDDGISREVLNVEFWGSTVLPAGKFTQHLPNNSYKSLRIVDEREGWLFNRWCFSNQTELYNTRLDPYELRNLAVDADTETLRLMDRLSGLLLVTKSCGQETCRKPWDVLRDAYTGFTNEADSSASFTTLTLAMDPTYDAFFASLPHFGFKECLPFQSVENERPYYPPGSASLGSEYRELVVEDELFWEENVVSKPKLDYKGGHAGAGSETQRFATWEDVMKDARVLTDEELGIQDRSSRTLTTDCGPADWCGQMFVHDDM